MLISRNVLWRRIMQKIVLLWMGVWACSSVALGAFDVTISSGYHGTQMLENQESLLMTGGGANGIEAYDSSYVEIRGTAPLQQFVGGISTIDLSHNSTMNYYGGETRGLYLYNNAWAVLYGGSMEHIDSYQYVPMPNNIAYPHIEMVVRDWSHNDQTNLLTGIWNVDNDNNSEFDTFSIQLYDQAGYDPVIENITFTVIPEPVTLFLFGFGGLAVCTVGKRKQLK